MSEKAVTESLVPFNSEVMLHLAVTNDHTQLPFSSSFSIYDHTELPFNSSFNASEHSIVPEGCRMLQWDDRREKLVSDEVEETFELVTTIAVLNLLFFIRFVCLVD